MNEYKDFDNVFRNKDILLDSLNIKIKNGKLHLKGLKCKTVVLFSDSSVYCKELENKLKEFSNDICGISFYIFNTRKNKEIHDYIENQNRVYLFGEDDLNLEMGNDVLYLTSIKFLDLVSSI